MTDFESWWAFQGCRTVGDPQDYARAGFEAGFLAGHRAAQQPQKRTIEQQLRDAYRPRTPKPFSEIDDGL